MTAAPGVVPSSVTAPPPNARPFPVRLLRGVGRIILGTALAVGIFLAFAALTSSQPTSLPDTTGQSSVGRTELALIDTSRPDPFLADGRSRELAIWIWYPAMAGSTEPMADYYPTEWSAVPATFPFAQDTKRVSTNAHEGAALDGTPPVVVLQPGLGLPVGDYTALAEELASHGYAVVGINETGSAGTAFPDGRVVPATAKGTVSAANVDDWYADAGRVTETWAADARFVVASLAATPPVIGALDFSRVAYIGHSLGGAAAFEACSQDRRCAAAVDLDGTLWTDVRHTGLRPPHLLVQKALDDACGDEFCRRATADFETVMEGDGRQISIAGSVHKNFQDDGLLPAVANRVGLGSIDGHRMTDIVRDTVRAFLDVHVRGNAPSDFATALSRYPEISVIR